MKPSSGVKPPFSINSRSQSWRCVSVTEGSSRESHFSRSARVLSDQEWSQRFRRRGIFHDCATSSESTMMGVAIIGATGRFLTAACTGSDGSLSSSSLAIRHPGGFGSTWSNDALSMRARSAARASPSGGASAPTADPGTRSKNASRSPAGRVPEARRRRPAFPSSRRRWISLPTPGSGRTLRSSTACSAVESLPGRSCSLAVSRVSASPRCCSRSWPDSRAMPPARCT